MKKEITSKKNKLFQVKQIIYSEWQVTFVFLFYWFWTGLCQLTNSIYFFHFLIIDHNHKCKLKPLRLK